MQSNLIYLEVDDDSAQRYLSKYKSATDQMILLLLLEFERKARTIVIDSFKDEFPTDEISFPQAYRQHLLSVLDSLDFININKSNMSITINLDALGDWDDFKRAWHYRALTPEEEEIELPYDGQELKNPPEIRTRVWTAITEGKTDIYLGQGRNAQLTGNEFRETIKARIDEWGNKAPQWLLLEWGSEGYPPIEPRRISQLIEIRLARAFQEDMRRVPELSKRQAELAGGFAYTVETASRVRGARGRFINKATLEVR